MNTTRRMPGRARRALALSAAAAVGSALLTVSATAPGSAATAASAASADDRALIARLREVPIPGMIHYAAGDYIVTLRDTPVSTYAGQIKGLRASRPAHGQQLDAHSEAAHAYVRYLTDRIDTVSAAAHVTPTARYTYAFNGFAAHLSASQARALAKRSDVVAVTPSRRHQLTAVPDYDFMGLEHQDAGGHEDGVWAKLGGTAKAGKGVVIGNIDSGIAPESPAFAGDVLGSTETADEPWRTDDGVIHFRKSDGGTFTGSCSKDIPSQQWSSASCNTKLVGARFYLDGFGRSMIGTPATGEYGSPRDGSGHGSHTGSTSAGGGVADATIGERHFGRISGVAPAAKIASYKVCWSGPDPATETDDGCMDEDLVAAIDQAVADGVDVINFSIGAAVGATTVYSPVDRAMLGAAAAGIFVSVSAGNTGDGASTADHGAPWYTTVAASTIPTYEATATFGDDSTAVGSSITVPAGGRSGRLVRGDLAALDGAATETADRCETGTLDPAKVTGRIVVCTRGVNARVEKSAEVARAGGIGMLLVNKTHDSLDLDVHSVPTIAIDAAHYDSIRAYAATPEASVSFADGNSEGDESPTPQVAGFSSRGPTEADGADVLKPDIAAPGVGILAAGPNASGADPTYEFMSGTSMAAPHITGLAALYLGAHPKATPAEIKSAMMTTAYPTVTDNGPLHDVFAEGAGQVDATRFLDPGMLFLSGLSDWTAYLNGLGYLGGSTTIDGSQLNQASIADGVMTGVEHITRTVTSQAAGTYRAQPADLDGFSVSVEPSVLTFAGPGETATFTVTVTRTDAPLDRFGQGSLDWIRDGDGARVHLPMAFRPVDALATEGALGRGVAGSVEIPYLNGVAGQPQVRLQGLVRMTHVADDGSASDPSHSGAAVEGQPIMLHRDVPAGTAALSFSLHAADPGADYDLYAFHVVLASEGEPGDILGAWGAEGAGPDEYLSVEDPEPGHYVLLAVPYTLTAGDVDLYEAQLSDDAAPFGITLASAGRTDVPGTENAATVAWRGLAPHSEYAGLARIGGRTTDLRIITGDGPLAPSATAPRALTLPQVTGRPRPGATLTATPGTWSTALASVSYQWRIGGVAVPGARGRTFVVPRSARGRAVTVAVTATAAGRAAGTVVSKQVLIGRQIARVVLRVQPLRRGVRATVSVVSSITPTGRLTVSVAGVRRTVRLVRGSATVRLRHLRPGRVKVRAVYAGSARVRKAHAVRSVRVGR